MNLVSDTRTAFLDLVYQDPDLVRAEFDALIAASWQSPPPPPAATPRPADRPAHWPSAPRPEPLPPHPRVPEGRRVTRQRSPPYGRQVMSST
jgi:hypothetical protein